MMIYGIKRMVTPVILLILGFMLWNARGELAEALRLLSLEIFILLIILQFITLGAVALQWKYLFLAGNVSNNIKNIISSRLCRGLQRIEEIGNLAPGFGEFYDRVFYHRLLQAELELAGLRVGDRVLHIGCGPRPMTAFYLARRGLMVTGVERDSEALKKAGLAVEQAGLTDRIELKQGNGLAGELSLYKAIWLSLHVDEKSSIIKRIIKTASRETTVIYRNPAGFLGLFYPGEKPENFSNIREHSYTRKILGKKSVLLKI